MNHSFTASLVSKTECAKCFRDIIAHTALAKCEACDNTGICEIWGSAKSPKSMLLCSKCYAKESAAQERANDVIIANTQLSIVAQGRALDSSIRFSGDFFNAETISLAALRNEIMSSTDDEATKLAKLQEVIVERMETFKARIVALDNEKYELVAKQQANINALREFGNVLRSDIRERIKNSDASYAPHQIIKVPKVSKPKQNPMERLIEMYATMNGVSKDAAKEMIMKGKAS